MTTYRSATVISLRGLRARARKFWHVGQVVSAKRELCRSSKHEGCPCDNGILTVIESGAFGCPAIVPSHMVEFRGKERDA